jgi:hypothetical protein
MRHRLAIAAALLLALAGCSDDSPGPKASASTSPATASPSPTGPVAPVLPEAAKANTSVGAKAFVRYWFEAATYAMKTGETGPMDAVASKDCDACMTVSRQVHGVFDSGKRSVGGGWNIDELQVSTTSTDRLRVFVAVIDQPARTLLDKGGKTIDRDPRTRLAVRVWASWGATGWELVELQEIK